MCLENQSLKFCPQTGYTYCSEEGKNDSKTFFPPFLQKAWKTPESHGIRTILHSLRNLWTGKKKFQVYLRELPSKLLSFGESSTKLSGMHSFLFQEWGMFFTCSKCTELSLLWAENGVQHSHWIWNMAPHILIKAITVLSLVIDLARFSVKSIKQFKHIMCHKRGELQ